MACFSCRFRDGLGRLNRLSSPQNPFVESPTGPESQTPGAFPPALPLPVKDPAWTGWDVLQLAVLTFCTPLVFLVIIASTARRFVYKGIAWVEIAQKPSLVLLAEFLGYVVVVLCMVALVEGRSQRRFWEALRWNWPKHTWRLLGLGVVLSISLQILGSFLPIPRNLPFERFFEHRMDAFLTSAFAISFGPFVEELFFRGFLYPVVAGHMGVAGGVLLTALAFGMVHALQLGFAWAAILIIFLVGVVLTTVRAVTHSVGASFLVHIAYNSTLTVLTFVGTDGFRHLDRLQ